ncbi:HD-GYP domain-containing protein [Mesotoga sp. UBA5825]|uniref:HD-GYP domain-containing protein n=1 Tax=Mesotoga sp. UBA5825 TaxID=1946858 RepID=UPI0025DFEE93|nr:HD-GYP domain-containing protein [Mesotoga sp. UBA5825]
MKNSRICGLALRFNYDDPESFRSELRAILDEEDLSREDLGILVALDFVYSQTFDETGVFDFSDVESELLAEGIYSLSYFFARNSEDKIAYLVSKLAVDLIAKECGKEQEINLKMLHMMTSFEMGFGDETLSLFAELVKLEEYVPTQKRFEYYNDLGLVSTQLQTGDNPWKFYERAKEVAESPVRMLMVQLNMIDYLYSKNRFAEAIELLDLAQGCNSEAVSIKGYKLMINLKILLQLNDLSRAAVIAEQLESLINSHIEWTDIAVSYIFLGHFYVKSGNVSRAENYLNQLKSLPDESLTSYIKGETLILEASIMQVKGEHFRALENSVGAFESLTLYSTTSPHLKDFVNNLFESISSVFSQLIRELRLKDDYTALHTLRVLKICYEFGKELDLEKIDLFNLSIGAMLHDYGKVDIPFDTLNKPSSLTEEEFTEIKRHPVYGERYLRDLNFPKAVRDIVRHHHERIDGNGYPDGLKGNEIHMLVQIVAVADVFDALTTDRPYRKAITKARALKYLEEKGDQLISKGLLTRFIEFSQRKEISVKEEEITALWRSIISELFK